MSYKKLLKISLDILLLVIFTTLMVYAFKLGASKELHRLQVVCEMHKAQGYPVGTCGNVIGAIARAN